MANKNDDVSLDFGSDEFFPLKRTNNDKKVKAPKGASGYFKNVARSVGNLGVKISKSLYPEAFSLSSDIKESLGESGTKLNYTDTKNKIKSTLESVKSTGKELVTGIGNDVKNAITTGKFVKSAADADAEMEAVFADSFGFGEDELDNFDFGSDFDDFGDDSETSNKKPRISNSEATIKSGKATTRLIARTSREQQATVIGATQTQIKHETKLFAQQIELSQIQHQQKMKLMMNIVSNVAKTVEQNNISLKAQMEFSAKSLAFSQDLAAMLKEIRDAQWKMTKPKETPEISKTGYQKIFGMGGGSTNFGEWLKQFKANYKANSFGGALEIGDQMKGMFEMMTGMGMSPAQAIKQLGGSFLFDALTKGALSYKNQRGLDMVNQKISGLPSAFNRMLGSIANGDNDLVKRLTSWGDKKGGMIGKLTGFLGNRIQDFAQAGYMKDTVSYKSGRFDMGNPEDIHPFDNKAHRAITEVIPGFLSKISAGINHTEEEVFDYKLNRYIKSSDLSKRYDLAAQEVYDSTRGIRDIESRMSSSLSSNDFQNSIKNSIKTLNIPVRQSKYVNADGTINEIEFSKEFPKMLQNFMRLGKSLDIGTLKKCKMRYINGNFESGLYSEDLLKDTGFNDDFDKYVACKAFVEAINNMRPNADSSDDQRMLWTDLTTSMESYNTRLSEANMQVEEENARFGSSSANEQIIYQKENQKRINEIKKQLEYNKKKLDTVRESNLPNAQKEITRYSKKVSGLQNELVRLTQQQSFGTQSINSGLMDSLGSSGGFSDYAISSLNDDSTNGLVRNIYNLLLSGLDVYPHSDINPEHSKIVNSATTTLSAKQNAKVNGIKEANDSAKYIELSEPCPSNEEERIKWFKTNDITDDVGNYIYDGSLYYKDSLNEWKKIKCNSSMKLEPNKLYYFSASEKRAFEQKRSREASFQSSGWMHNTPLKNVPIIGDIIKKYDSVVGKVNDFTGGVLGDIFYGEKNGTKNKVENVASAAKNKVGEVTKNTKEFYDKNIKGKTLTQIAKDGIDAVKKIDIKALVSAGLVSGKALVDAGIDKGQASIKELYEKGLITKDKLVGKGAEKLKKLIGEENYNKIVKELGLASDFVSDKFNKAKDKVSQAAHVGKDKVDSGIQKVKGFAERVFNKENADSIEGAIGKGKSALSSIKNGVIGGGVAGVLGGLSKFFSHDNKTDVSGDTAEEMQLNKVEKAKLKEEKKKTDILQKIYGFMNKITKDGIGLDKKTMEGIDESNVNAAERSGGGSDGGFSGDSGELKSKLLKKGMDYIGGKKFKNSMIGKTKFGRFLRKTRVMAGRSGIIKNGVFNSGAAKSVISKGVATKAGTIAAGAGGGIKRIIDFVCKIPKIAKTAGSSILNNIKTQLVKFIARFAPRLAARISAASAAAATLYGILALIVAGFVKGIADAKNIFKIGHGMKLTAGMRICAGLAEAFNAALMGIPNIMASLLGKPNVAMWFYELIGSKVEKMQLEIYREYNKRRAVIFGIKDPDALVAFENRNNNDNIGTKALSGLKRLGNNAISALTLGFANNADEKDMNILGFKTVNIYKYWKEKKFTPLDNLRKTVAENYGGISAIEKMVKIDPDKIDEADQSDDPNATETEESKDADQEAFEKQNEYRRDYLEQAKKYVLDNNLAWLTSECTPEKFKKYTGGKDAGEETGKGFKGRMRSVKNHIMNKTPVGLAVKAGKKAVAKVAQGAKFVGDWMKNIFKKYNLNDTGKQMMTAAGAAIQKVQTDVDPTFFGENDAENVKPEGSSEGGIDDNNTVHVGQNGGASSTGEGYFVKVVKDNANKKASTSSNTTERASPDFAKKLKEDFSSTHYDTSGKTPKSLVMNSIVEDFAKKFGNDLNKRLDVLDEMHKEQVRHNTIAEDFFKAALTMMVEISKHSGNTETTSKIRDMINTIVK